MAGFGYTPKKATKLELTAKRIHIAALRKKVGNGTATTDEMNEVRQWDSIPRRGRKPKITVPATGETPPPGNTGPGKPGNQATPDSPSSDGKVEVFSSLPGMESQATTTTLPPLNVDPGFHQPNASAAGNPAPSQSQGQTTGPSAPNASTNGNASSGTPPKMGPQEAEATGQMVASLCTGLLKDLNDYARDKGQIAIGEQFLAMFHFSVKRLTMKHGNAIDEDTMDYTVVCGAAGFVGFNAYRGWKIEKDAALWDKSPKAEGKVTPPSTGQSPTSEPLSNRMGENDAFKSSTGPAQQSGAIVPFENTGKRGRNFDPGGVF